MNRTASPAFQELLVSEPLRVRESTAYRPAASRPVALDNAIAICAVEA